MSILSTALMLFNTLVASSWTAHHHQQHHTHQAIASMPAFFWTAHCAIALASAILFYKACAGHAAAARLVCSCRDCSTTVTNCGQVRLLEIAAGYPELIGASNLAAAAAAAALLAKAMASG